MNRRVLAHCLTLVKAAAQSVAIVIAFYLAFSIRFDGRIPAAYRSEVWACLPFLVAARVLSLFAVTRFRLRWRFTSLTDSWLVLQAVMLGSIVFYLALSIFHRPPVPHGVLLLEALLTLQFTLAMRVAARLAWNRRSLARFGKAPETSRRVLIVGADDAGQRIVRDMKEDPAANLLPVGFADDDPAKYHRLIHGVLVHGTTEEIPALVEKLQADQVLIASPAINGEGIQRIVRICDGVKAELTLLPSLPQMLSSAKATGHIRKVAVEDLLERTPVRVDTEEIAGYLSGERVLITGAGGSIGSELCRQIAGLNPESIILLGQGENSVFWIEHELRQEIGARVTAVIADVKDRHRLDDVFTEHRPTVVFHAAAHKHVPLMEQNPEEAIKNNVFGTRNLAELSIEHGVKRFVMISTDKAVNPTSVMGATKRVAEMVVQSLAQRIEAARAGDGRDASWSVDRVRPDQARTRFAAVRFGNVLGSRGSVIPTMQRQIEKGGPVTVTHPEMVRFFMTIPEAVQLVIQAGAMSRNGEVFVLDMGRPVKIMDLARNLIRLSGFTPERDIPIEITGIRPGEKLYEEVLTAEEGTTKTAHEKIFVARPARVDHTALENALAHLEAAVFAADRDRIRRLLKEIVPTFSGVMVRKAAAPERTRKAKHNGRGDQGDRGELASVSR